MSCVHTHIHGMLIYTDSPRWDRRATLESKDRCLSKGRNGLLNVEQNLSFERNVASSFSKFKRNKSQSSAHTGRNVNDFQRSVLRSWEDIDAEVSIKDGNHVIRGGYGSTETNVNKVLVSGQKSQIGTKSKPSTNNGNRAAQKFRSDSGSTKQGQRSLSGTKSKLSVMNRNQTMQNSSTKTNVNNVFIRTQRTQIETKLNLAMNNGNYTTHQFQSVSDATKQGQRLQSGSKSKLSVKNGNNVMQKLQSDNKSTKTNISKVLVPGHRSQIVTKSKLSIKNRSQTTQKFRSDSESTKLRQRSQSEFKSKLSVKNGDQTKQKLQYDNGLTKTDMNEVLVPRHRSQIGDKSKQSIKNGSQTTQTLRSDSGSTKSKQAQQNRNQSKLSIKNGNNVIQKLRSENRSTKANCNKGLISGLRLQSVTKSKPAVKRSHLYGNGSRESVDTNPVARKGLLAGLMTKSHPTELPRSKPQKVKHAKRVLKKCLKFSSYKALSAFELENRALSCFLQTNHVAKGNSKVNFTFDKFTENRGQMYSIPKFRGDDHSRRLNAAKNKSEALLRAYQDALAEAFGVKEEHAILLRLNNTEVQQRELKYCSYNPEAVKVTSEKKQQNFSRALQLISTDHSLVNKPFCKVNSEFNGMTLLFAAVMFGSPKLTYALLQLGADPRHKDEKQRKAQSLIRNRMEKRSQRKLLALYEQSQSCIDMSCNVREWRRVELTINRIEKIVISERCNSLNFSKNIFCRISCTFDSNRTSATSIEDVTENISFTSKPFRVVLNASSFRFSNCKVVVKVCLGNNQEGKYAVLSKWEQNVKEVINIMDSGGHELNGELEGTSGSYIEDGAKLFIGINIFISVCLFPCGFRI